MGEYVRVSPQPRLFRFLGRLCGAIYRFFAYVGDGIIRFPNRPFYAILAVLCILAPFFAVFVVIVLLCAVYRRDKAWQQ